MKRRNSFWVKRSHKKRNILIVLGIMVTLIAIAYDVNAAFVKENNSLVQGLSNSLIRFHVIANSDSAEDQALKVTVKDQVIALMQGVLEDSKSISESREIILANLGDIKIMAEETLAANGSRYPVTVALEKEGFPLKQYGDVVLPPGEYEALVIRIGEAKGKNWWCVLFPPLCFVDATHGVIDDQSKAELKDVLTDEEYSSIIMNKESKVNIKVKSKLLDWFEKKEQSLLKNSFLARIFN